MRCEGGFSEEWLYITCLRMEASAVGLWKGGMQAKVA